MNSNEFSKELVSGYGIRQEGGTVFIDIDDSIPKEIDYTDYDSVKILATNAVHTANGLYDLIKDNCNTQNPDPSPKAHLEMYLALTALACEIYMKSIIYNENLHDGKKCTGHKLEELFQKIPNITQEKIRTKISNIDSILPFVGDIFTTLRYDFELNSIQGDYLIVFVLVDILKEISNSYPKKPTSSIRYADGTLSID